MKVTQSYHSLQKQSKASFLSSGRNLIQHVLQFLARDDCYDVEQDLFLADNGKSDSALLFQKYFSVYRVEYSIVYDRQFVPVMRGIAGAYDNADNRTTRRSILSIVAPKIPFSVLQTFIPGINYYRFTAARTHPSGYGTGAMIEQLPRVVARLEPSQVDHFIDFIVSDHVCTDIPFDQQTLALSDGTKLHVSDTIRNCNASRIINQYYQYTLELFPDFPVLHESTLYKILNGCKASTRRAISGLNYFAANGSEAFDNLSVLINTLSLDKDKHHRLTSNIKRGKQYLKTDFKVNVGRKSRVPDHCICFSLSDPTSSSFSTSCLNHDHDQLCSECLYLAQTLEEIRETIEKSTGEEELKRKMYKFTLARDAIQSWKCH